MSIIERLAHYFIPHPSNNHKARFLESRSILIFAGIFALVQLIFSYKIQIGPAILGYASNIVSDTVVKLTNDKRAALGLNSLKTDPELTVAATLKAADMFSKNYWAHVAPDGTQPWYFISKAGYDYLLAGENLARDFNDSSAVVEAWMNSPSHKENLLNPKYQDIGVAVANGKLGGVETTLVVQMFGTRLTKIPQIDSEVSGAKTVSAKEPLNPVTPTRIASTPTAIPLPTISVIAPESGTSAKILTNIPRQPSDDRETPAKYIISPLSLTRGFASFILILLFTLFLVDAIIVYRLKIVRVSADTAAHIAFLTTVIIAIWLIRSGVIL